jgi:hypothetical protein
MDPDEDEHTRDKEVFTIDKSGVIQKRGVCRLIK